MDTYNNELTALQIDTIREISNIGMGNAATALSQMVDSTVTITVPEAVLIDITAVPSLYGGEDTEVAASYVKVVGDVRGHLLIAFPVDDAHLLIELMMPGQNLNLMADPKDEMAYSAIQEIGNILSSSYLRSLAEMTQLNILPTVPAVAVDYAGSIVGYVVTSLEEVTEKLVVVKTNFDIGGKSIVGHCIFIPEAGSLKIMLDSLGVGNS